MVWTLPTAQADMIAKLPTEHLTKLVQIAFHHPHVDLKYFFKNAQDPTVLETIDAVYSDLKVPNVVSIKDGSVATFPLRLRNATEYIQDRLALIGFVSL